MSAHPLTPTEPSLTAYLQSVEKLLQRQLSAQTPGLATFSRTKLREDMDLFTAWHVVQYRKITPDAAEAKLINTAFDCLADTIVGWPTVYLHGDAILGPVTYDIARFTRDASQPWEEDFCLDVTVRYWEKARKAGLPVGDDFGEFYRGVEWTGLQQHLTQAGQCARRAVESGDNAAVQVTPQLISHIRHTCHRYREFRPLARLVEKFEGIQVAQSYAFGRT